TGTITIGSAADDIATFNGGIDTTVAGGTKTLNGSVITSGDDADFGAITLGSNVILDTGNAATGTLSVGAVTGAGNTLTLDSGSTAGATINVTSVDNVGTLTLVDAGGAVTIGNVGAGTAGAVTITDSQAGVTFTGTFAATTLTLTDTTGTVTFNGDASITTLTTAAQGYNVAFDENVTVTNDVTFSNTGTITIGSAADDIATFTGGIDTTAGSTETLNGT
ncbi:MAG: hypothetical protein JJ973_19215, partial [Rhodospirillales bacterium]|nr:hypothetical protein [Rhodospirillales bacterium]